MASNENGDSELHNSLQNELEKLLRWKTEATVHTQEKERRLAQLEDIARDQQQQLKQQRQKEQELQAQCAIELRAAQELGDTARHTRDEVELTAIQLDKCRISVAAASSDKVQLERETAVRMAALDGLASHLQQLRLNFEKEVKEVQAERGRQLQEIRQSKEKTRTKIKADAEAMAAIRVKVEQAALRTSAQAERLVAVKRRLVGRVTERDRLRGLVDQRLQDKEAATTARASEEQDLLAQQSELAAQLKKRSQELASETEANDRERAINSELSGQLAVTRQKETAKQERCAQKQAANQALTAEVREYERRLAEIRVENRRLESEAAEVDRIDKEHEVAAAELATYGERIEDISAALVDTAWSRNRKFGLQQANLDLSSNILSLERHLSALVEEHQTKMTAINKSCKETKQELETSRNNVTALELALEKLEKDEQKQMEEDKAKEQQLKDKLRGIEEATRAREAQLEAADQRLATARAATVAAHIQIQGLKDEIAETDVSLEKAEIEKSSKQQRLSDIRARHAALAEQLQEADKKLAGLRAQLEARLAARDLATAAAVADTAQEAAKIKQLEKELQQVGKDVTAGQRREAKLAKQLAKNEADMEKMRDEAASLNAAHISVDEELVQLRTGNEAFSEKVARLQAEKENRSIAEESLQKKKVELEQEIQKRVEQHDMDVYFLREASVKAVKDVFVESGRLATMVREREEKIRQITEDRNNRQTELEEQRAALELEIQALETALQATPEKDKTTARKGGSGPLSSVSSSSPSQSGPTSPQRKVKTPSRRRFTSPQPSARELAVPPTPRPPSWMRRKSAPGAAGPVRRSPRTTSSRNGAGKEEEKKAEFDFEILESDCSMSVTTDDEW